MHNNKYHDKVNNFLPNKIIDQMISDRKIRKNIAQASFLIFFHFYFAHYIKYKTAFFQKEIIRHLEENTEDLYLISFRNSGKSTIVTTAYPIWAILGKLQKKFVVIVCQTKEQAKLHMSSLKQELESNVLLKRDLGPFKEESDEWNVSSVKFTKSGAKIMIASLEQSIRGLRHSENRPDLFILDDIEDISSTRTRERRDKTYRWLKGELIPAGDRNTRLVMIGNMLHEDCVLQRLKEEVEENKIDGKFMFIPLIDENNKSNWPGKYPTDKEIETEKRKIGNEVAWRREYLLEIVSDYDQIIQKEWIHRYTELPKKISSIRVAIDLAVSEKDTADNTAIIIGLTTGYGNTMCMYILPNPINEKMKITKTMEICKQLNSSLYSTYKIIPKFFIEGGGTQKGLVDVIKDQGLDVEEVSPQLDKRSRLNAASIPLQSGKVFFPTKGCEELENQLINFPMEKYDDLTDAFSIITTSLSTNPIPLIGFF